MTGQESQNLEAERAAVTRILEETLAALPDGMSQFAQEEFAQNRSLLVSGVVLAAAVPAEDSPEARERRIALAAALELLQIALNIHRLLLLAPARADTIDKSLLGGTVLVGDFCFSRAAVLAARTQNPRVVTIFAELLKQLSEKNLRRILKPDPAAAEAAPGQEQATLFHSGAQAGAVLAGLSSQEQSELAAFAAGLARAESPSGRMDASLPAHQHTRWQLLADSLS